jgi:hypothetical protein
MDELKIRMARYLDLSSGDFNLPYADYYNVAFKHGTFVYDCFCAKFDSDAAKEKPRIRFFGNGDVHISCIDVHRKCYPGKVAKYRSNFIPFNDYFAKRLKISLIGSNDNH